MEKIEIGKFLHKRNRMSQRKYIVYVIKKVGRLIKKLQKLGRFQNFDRLNKELWNKILA